MGDHRATIHCEFSMHGHEAKQDWWINQDPEGCDLRVVEWFDEQVRIAMARYNNEMADYWSEKKKAEIETSERAELGRLKNKYEK